MVTEDYEAGKRDGKIEAMRQMLSHHSTRIDAIERSLRIQERVTYSLLGALALIQLLPTIKGVIT